MAKVTIVRCDGVQSTEKKIPCTAEAVRTGKFKGNPVDLCLDCGIALFRALAPGEELVLRSLKEVPVKETKKT